VLWSRKFRSPVEDVGNSHKSVFGFQKNGGKERVAVPRVPAGRTEMAFVRTVKVDEVPPGTIRELQVEGTTIALANIEGKFYAINNVCLHRGGPLGQGPLGGRNVTCPWHAWQYDVTTGRTLQNPAVGVDCYPTEVRGQDVFVDIASERLER